MTGPLIARNLRRVTAMCTARVDIQANSTAQAFAVSKIPYDSPGANLLRFKYIEPNIAEWGIACENSRFPSLLAAGDVSQEERLRLSDRNSIPCLNLVSLELFTLSKLMIPQTAQASSHFA